MKKILNIIFVIALISIGFASCDDYLEKPPSTDITEDTVFSNLLNAKKMLYTLYGSVPYGFSYNTSSVFRKNCRMLLSATTDEGEAGPTWGISNNYNTGNVNQTNVNSYSDFNYTNYYKAIRYSWKFIERIDEVPDATSQEKSVFKAEAKMIIAMNYYEMMIRLGGVPYVDHAYTAVEDWKIERMPMAQLCEKIETLINDAINELPDSRIPEEEGRFTKGFGYFLKARLRIAVARPLFNTGNPYLSMNDLKNNNLICMGNEDKNRYKLAADACKEAINYLESKGHRLLQASDAGGDAKEAYSRACKFANSVNPEMIYYVCLAKNIVSMWDWRVAEYGPRVQGNGFLQPTENFKRQYQLSNGKLQTESNGYNPQDPYKNLDPRFYASFIWHGSKFGANYYSMVLKDNITDARVYDPNKNLNWLVGRASTERCRTGYHMRKFIHEEIYQNPAQAVTPIWPYMRMAELYLIYAEALNEFNNGPLPECYDAINNVRTRCGMPRVEGLNYESIKEMIEYEWMAEFAFEGTRFFNMRQWKKPEIFNVPILSSDISRDKNDKSKLVYSTSTMESRKFESRFYLYPFPLSEVDMNYGLVQNPGWE